MIAQQSTELRVGTFVRRANGNTPTVREIVYLRPDGRAAAVYLNQEFEVTEIVLRIKEPTKAKPEGEQYWAVAGKEKKAL